MLYTVSQKRHTWTFPNLCQILTDFQDVTGECDHCGWTGKPTKPWTPETNTSFNTPDIQRDGSSVASYRSFTSILIWSVLFIYQHTCWLLMLVLLTFIFHTVV